LDMMPMILLQIQKVYETLELCCKVPGK